MADNAIAKKSHLGAASLVTAAVLLLSHTGYQRLADQYSQVSSSVPLPEGTLGRIPSQIGGWVGQDKPLDPTIVKFTDTDDRLNRIYTRGGEALMLYVAYGVRLRDLQPHRPENCYIGAGWTLETYKPLNLQTAEGEPLPVQVQTFSRGDLNREQVTVLNYYLVNGLYSADVSGLRREAAKLSQSRSYSVQVQIACGGAGEAGMLAVKTFAQDSAGPIKALIVQALREMTATAPAADAKEQSR